MGQQEIHVEIKYILIRLLDFTDVHEFEDFFFLIRSHRSNGNILRLI